MKKHHHFERRKTKALLVSALATVAVCNLVSCAEQSELPELPTSTLGTPQIEETFTPTNETTTAFSALDSAPAESDTLSTETQVSATTKAPLPETETTTETEPTKPALRAERTEETVSIPFETIYEYSNAHYEGTHQIIRTGESGECLRVTITTFEADIPMDVTVTETVLREPVAQIILIGTKNVFSYKEITETENIIPHGTETRKDPSRYDDESTVIQEGIDGFTEVTYRITYEKGIEISRERIDETVIDPQTEILSVGTKPAWTEKTITERENTVPYQTEYRYDNTVAEGTRIVKTPGEDGYTAVTYRKRYYRGELSSKDEISRKEYAPTTEVIVIGTKKEEAYGLPFYAGNGYYLSQDFGNGHYALDFAIWYGDPILAIQSGTVIYAYDEGDFPKSDANWTYGTFVVIEHENGVRSLYAHLKSRTVQAGQKVSAGQVIGYSGNTGRVNPAPTPSNPLAGTHLHFEIRVKKNGSYVKVDPKQYIPDF